MYMYSISIRRVTTNSKCLAHICKSFWAFDHLWNQFVQTGSYKNLTSVKAYAHLFFHTLILARRKVILCKSHNRNPMAEKSSRSGYDDDENVKNCFPERT